MMFRNPWIDPRVLKVMPSDAEAYLADHGWQRLKTTTSGVIPFKRPSEGTIVNLPIAPDEVDYPQRVIDLVAALAFAEDRWAVDVLADILHANNAATGGNGSAAKSMETAKT